jgi:hypothetical protein
LTCDSPAPYDMVMHLRTLLAVFALAGSGSWSIASGPVRARERDPATREKAASPPDPLVVPYLGTWMHSSTIQSKGGTIPQESYILFKWHRGQLHVKTLDYLPTLQARLRESDWRGRITVDSWNEDTQTFTPRPDGSLSIGLGGSNLVGPEGTAYWWASGRIVLLEGGKKFRYVTEDGYAPSSKGNLWVPVDVTYDKISDEIDPRFDAVGK